MLLETLWASKHRTFSMICRERVRGLESRKARKRLVGSNPTPSARAGIPYLVGDSGSLFE